MAASPIMVQQAPASKRSAPVKLDRLALLYEGIFTVIVRVQTGRQQLQDVDAFRGRMKEALREIGDLAARRRYEQEDVQEANFAIVAFLDEVVMTSQSDANTQWARKSLQEELFEQRSAGEAFFKRLETLRAGRDSQQLAEVLEVYYLCLLLGYEGKYAGGSKAELQLLMSNLRDRLERLSATSPEFSPDANFPDTAIPTPPAPESIGRQLLLYSAIALIFAVVCFTAFWLDLHSKTTDIERAVHERVAP
jgi:type VI secretion system protein ImpK